MAREGTGGRVKCVVKPVTSDERYKDARGRGKGRDCYERGRESPWLDSKIYRSDLMSILKKRIRTVSGFTSLL